MTPISLGIFASANTTVNTSYESIAVSSVGAGGASTITFSSIPSTYTHLQIRGIYRSTFANPGFEELKIQLNSDTGSNYAYHWISGNGTAASSSNGTSQTGARTVSSFPSDQTTASSYGAAVIDILDYTNTNKYKTLRVLSGADTNGNGYVGLSSGLWMNTASVTSVTLGNWATSEIFKQYSHFALYGIKAA